MTAEITVILGVKRERKLALCVLLISVVEDLDIIPLLLWPQKSFASFYVQQLFKGTLLLCPSFSQYRFQSKTGDKSSNCLIHFRA